MSDRQSEYQFRCTMMRHRATRYPHIICAYIYSVTSLYGRIDMGKLQDIHTRGESFLACYLNLPTRRTLKPEIGRKNEIYLCVCMCEYRMVRASLYLFSESRGKSILET